MIMEINNGAEAAVKSGKWSHAKARELFGAIALKDNSLELGREGFLIFPRNAFDGWPRASGLDRCKYPHHVVIDDTLVVSVPGLRAAYARAIQQRVFTGKLKEHLMAHYNELGLNADTSSGFTESMLADINTLPENIRPLTGDDVTSDYFIDWFFKMDEFVNDSPANFDFDILIDSGNTSNRCYGYFIDDNLEGIIRVRYNNPIDTYAVSMLFVNKLHQGEGIGTSLIELVISMYGGHDMTLNVFGFNANAIRLYTSMGFKIYETNIYKDGPESDPRYVGKEMYKMKREANALPVTEATISGIDRLIEENFNLIETFTERKLIEIDITVKTIGDLQRTAKTPDELLHWLKSNCETGDGVNGNVSMQTKLLHPDDLIDAKRGTCLDFVELERAWFKKNYPGKFKIFAIIADYGETAHPIHTFLLYYSPNKVTWFEYSWAKYQGGDDYLNEEAALTGIVKKFRIGHPVDRCELRELASKPEYGLSWSDFIQWLSTQPKVEVNKATGSLSASDYVPVFGIVKSYSQNKLRADGTEKDVPEQNSMRFDKILRLLTRGDNYSHALVSLDPDLEKMYSFEDEGLEIDGIHDRPSWLGTKSIYVTVMFITKAERETMQAYLNYLIENKADTTYGMSDLLKMMVSKPVKQDKRFVCSTLTGYILSMGNRKNLQRDYSRIRPEDITILPRAFYVTNFSDAMDFDRRKIEFQAKVNQLKTDNWEEIDEYNNQLPRLLLKNNLSKLKTLDKIFGWIIDKM